MKGHVIHIFNAAPHRAPFFLYHDPNWVVVSTPLKNITVYCCLCVSHEAEERPHNPAAPWSLASGRRQIAHVLLRGSLAAKLGENDPVNFIDPCRRPPDTIAHYPFGKCH